LGAHVGDGVTPLPHLKRLVATPRPPRSMAAAAPGEGVPLAHKEVGGARKSKN
jgi:hypothetical protein